MGNSVFPNYYEVELGGKVAKVAPLRLNSEENLELAELIGQAADEGDFILFIKNAKRFVPALRQSLLENHSVDETEFFISNVRASLKMTSPFMQCMFSLMGRGPVTDDDMARLAKPEPAGD